jgi:transcriptional regulator with XRE-family HTH domain
MAEFPIGLKGVGERIRYAREAMDWTQQELAEAVAVSVQAVSQWENEKTFPGLDRILTISNVLGIHPGYMLWGDAFSSSDTHGEMLSVPLVQANAVARWDPTDYPPKGLRFDRWFLPSNRPQGSMFVIEIEDESMLPTFKPGDHVFMDTGVEPAPGDFVVVIFENEADVEFSTFQLRKYRPRGNDERGRPVIELAPMNDDFPTITLTHRTAGRLLGCMVEHRSYRRTSSSTRKNLS